MARRIAFLFLICYALSATEAYQLLKLPYFVSHFFRHCQQNPETTFIGFLTQHYAEKIVVDDDYEEDMQLPFKTHEESVHVFQVSLPAQAMCFTPPVPFFKPIQFSLEFPHFFPSQYLNCIFQPPRVLV